MMHKKKTDSTCFSTGSFHVSGVTDMTHTIGDSNCSVLLEPVLGDSRRK
jgi:hypothetical protein